MTRCGVVLAVALVAAACEDTDLPGRSQDASIDAGQAVHGHDVDAGDPDAGEHATHVPRDLADVPCTADNWRELGADLRQCALAGADLSGASLRRADLSEADLTGANLEAADLFNASLLRATLTGAVLDRAHLAGVDFTDADLSGATLQGADMTSATLERAVLDGAQTGPETICPDGTPGPCW